MKDPGDSGTQPAEPDLPAPSDSQPPVQETNPDNTTTGEHGAPAPAAPPAAAGSPISPGKPTDEAIYGAFLLGWLIMELRSRIRIEFDRCNSKTPPAGSGFQLASQWRALFTRIADLQHSTFPDGVTAQTLYDPPILDYLHPKEGNDYADIGIRAASKDGGPMLKNFKLYEETRRAINTLSLLYVSPDDSLAPDQFQSIHQRVRGAVLAGSEPPKDLASVLAAKEILTRQAEKFIDAWDGYLRENYFVGGIIPDDDMELVAYSAGNTMASLSWKISAATVTLEERQGADGDQSSKCLEVWKDTFRQQDIIRLQHQISALSSVLDHAYYDKNPKAPRPANDDPSTPPNPDLPSQAILAVKQSIDYWERAVEWVAETAEKNKAAKAADAHLTWTDQDKMNWWRDLRLALTEQTNIWQTLITGQQSLRSFNLESITRHMMKDVTDKIQSSLHQDFRISLGEVRKATAEIAQEVSAVVGDVAAAAKTGLHDLIEGSRRYLMPILVIMGVLGVIVIVLGVLIVQGKTDNPVAGIGGASSGGAGIIGAIAAYLQLKKTSRDKDSKIQEIDKKTQTAAEKLADAPKKVQDASSSTGNTSGGLLERFEGAAGDARATVMTAFQKGYDQIRIELGSLSRSTAVAYPLIEFFSTVVKDSKFAAGFGIDNRKEAFSDFLDKVIWNTQDRQEDIQRVISAAFGPLAVFMTGQKTDAK